MGDRVDSFESFWPVFVRAHAHPLTRSLHLGGAVAALGGAGVALALGRPRWLPVAAAAAFAPAWLSHWLLEGNRPPGLQHPWWSLRATGRMFARIIAGTMETEVEKARRRKPTNGESTRVNVAVSRPEMLN